MHVCIYLCVSVEWAVGAYRKGTRKSCICNISDIIYNIYLFICRKVVDGMPFTLLVAMVTEH